MISGGTRNWKTRPAHGVPVTIGSDSENFFYFYFYFLIYPIQYGITPYGSRFQNGQFLGKPRNFGYCLSPCRSRSLRYLHHPGTFTVIFRLDLTRLVAFSPNSNEFWNERVDKDVSTLLCALDHQPNDQTFSSITATSSSSGREVIDVGVKKLQVN